MEREIASTPASTSLTEVDAILKRSGCSSLPVTEDGVTIGVISRTDLLKVGRREAASHEAPLFLLPGMQAGEVATRPAVVVAPETTVSAAAALMVKSRIHRVYVEHDRRIVGVLSTTDLLTAIVTDRVATPTEAVMSQPVFTLPVAATINHAMDRLAAAHVSGLVIIDEEGWPVGFFTQREALESRAHEGDSPVEDAMNCALVCLHARAPLYRAAALAHAARARRVLVINGGRVIGLVSPLDFARAISA